VARLASTRAGISGWVLFRVRAEPGRAEEGDPVQVGDQRAALVGQGEQLVAQPGHGEDVDLPAAVRITYPGSCRTRMVRLSWYMAGSPPLVRA